MSPVQRCDVSVGRRAPLTTFAAVLALAVTAFFVWQGIGMVQLLDGSVDAETRRRMVMTSVGRESTTLLAALGAVVLGLCVMTGALGVGLLARREWAREGAMFVFGAFGGVVLALSIGGLLSGSPDAPEGLLVGLADATVAGLLLTGAVADDFDAAAKERTRRGKRPRAPTDPTA